MGVECGVLKIFHLMSHILKLYRITVLFRAMFLVEVLWENNISLADSFLVA